MKKLLSFLFSILFAGSSLFAQKSNSIRIAFYNPENIFDTIDNPKTNDEEFLPQGKNKWDSKKYDTKLRHTARVINEINVGKGADMIGFSEIENKSVLQDLCTKTELKKMNYDIVHYDSPDERGIDVGFIYKKDVYKVIDSKAYSINFPFDAKDKTRDVLLVKGEIKKNKSKLYIIVNHWPSRRGGEDASEPSRIFVAEKVKAIVDSIKKTEKEISFVLLGDFNDTPTNKSIVEGLKTTKDTTSSNNELFNLMEKQASEGKGTHYYKGEKSMLDQIIISKNLFGGKKLYTYSNSGKIFEQDWLMERHPKSGEIQPFRTYVGNAKYIGGYSDHLPIYMDIYVK